MLVRSSPMRVGAVSYLNARPLTFTLDRDTKHWLVRYDTPSACAALLHRGDIELGLIPSVDFLQSPDYCLVPGIAVASYGPVVSVALYTSKPVSNLTSVAIDVSSKTSVALLKVLCAKHFCIDPVFVPHDPDLSAMVNDNDAALVIGDPALEAKHDILGLEKIDLGLEWTHLTKLPFVYAAWTGKRGVISKKDVELLQLAKTQGITEIDAIAAEYATGDPAMADRASAYLRENVRYELGSDEISGLQLFLHYASDLGYGFGRRTLEFY